MPNPGFPTPQDAEAAFYAAFENKDLAAMMRVWANNEQIECIHPMGMRLQGVEAVKRSWQRIFADGLPLKFTITDTHRTQDSTFAIHVLHENIVTETDQTAHPPVVTTNIYQHTEDGWHMILHHASPSTPGATEEGMPGDDTILH